MQLGPLTLETDLILAPMMDVTTPSFRKLIIDQGGVGLIVTPMIFVQQVAKAPKTVLPHMEYIEKQRPAAVQIVSSGKNEKHMKTALDILNSYDFDLLDLNVGCPAPHTMRSGGGGGYLREYHREGHWDRLEKLVILSLKYADVPVALKTRLGFEDKTDILDLAPLLEDWGISILSLHGRTINQKYRDTVDLDGLKQVKELIDIPVIGNGDVRNYDDYIQMKITTNVDAIMIGRAVMNDPFVFKKIYETKQAIEKGQPIPTFPEHLSIPQIQDLLKQNDQFLANSSEYWNTPRFRGAEMRRLAIWFIKGIPGYKKVRRKLSRMRSIIDLTKYIFSAQFEDDFSIDRTPIQSSISSEATP